MRDDMKKVLVTTPRVGSSWRNQEVLNLRRQKITEEYDGPQRASMKPSHQRYTERKQLNENLNPLIRYLRKNCGRPWDKVYSEIKDKNPLGNAVTEHIYQHLFDFVELNPVFKDKVPYTNHGKYPIYENGWPAFYINGVGILVRSKHKRPKYKKPHNPRIVKLDDESFLIQREEDKVWFMIRYAKPIKITRSFQSGRTYTWYDKPNEVKIKGLELPRVIGKYANFSKTLSKKEKKLYNL